MSQEKANTEQNFNAQELSDIMKSLAECDSAFFVITKKDGEDGAFNHDGAVGDIELMLNGLYGSLKRNPDLKEMICDLADTLRKEDLEESNKHRADTMDEKKARSNERMQATKAKVDVADSAVIVTIKDLGETSELGFCAKGTRMQLAQAFTAVFKQDPTFRMIIEAAMFHHQIENDMEQTNKEGQPDGK